MQSVVSRRLARLSVRCCLLGVVGEMKALGHMLLWFVTAAGVGCTPLLSIPDYSWRAPRQTTFVRSRLTAHNRAIELDGKPILLRGVTYSPTPIGKDMSAVDPALRVADFFVEANAAVWRRDLPLMRRMGVNAMRLYELQAEGDHNAFDPTQHHGRRSFSA